MSPGQDERVTTADPIWAAAIATAHARWPPDWLADEVFVAHLRARIAADDDAAAALSRLAVADLYLACACARGVEPAVESFTRTILREVDVHVASFDRSAAFADEVRQDLAARLLVAVPGARPRLDDYAGSAPLSAWVRVAAIRTALNLRRRKAFSTEVADDRAVAQQAASGDVEVEHIRRMYQAPFETAIGKALGGLSTRDRTLLRLRMVEGVEVEAIATMYGVHRTTVTRWIGACRERLLDETRRILRDDFGLALAEIDSLAGLVRSQLHVSVARLLGEP
ncbi:MAG TPA: sigma-70 family RNA polymerase sigma factor [Kofleriaceae bacterium]|nr:sigma-70 family RNA polymerase sigma factor [Kofleriaceae bacterium]